MEGTIIDLFSAEETAAMKRRVPGSGIVKNQASPQKTSLAVLPSLKSSSETLARIAPSLPKPRLKAGQVVKKHEITHYWRHAFAVTLLIMVTIIGVGQRADHTSATASKTTRPIAHAAAAPTALQSLLPAVKNVTLPPIPTRKTTGNPPNFAASNIVLIDDTSKTVLYQKGQDQSIAIASTTKTITAIVAIENYKNLDKLITISPEAANQIGSAVGFRAGEQATIKQLLHGLLMVSGNDAAYALAEEMAQPGDANKTDRFVAKMNELAARLDAKTTKFLDPAGLNDQGHSTALDMTHFYSLLLTHPELVDIIHQAEYTYTSPQNYQHIFKNSTRLTTEEMYYQGIIGGKTGFTPKTAEGGAGHCLIVAAERDGHRLIAAVYDTYSQAAPASAEVAKALLDYGFTQFTWQNVTR